MTRAADGSSASVRARVKASLPGLSKKQQVVAHYLLNNATGALFSTAGGSCSIRVGLSTAVRFGTGA
jgi:DNA-binding MurR/RpiR family transcriptional regulator